MKKSGPFLCRRMKRFFIYGERKVKLDEGLIQRLCGYKRLKFLGKEVDNG